MGSEPRSSELRVCSTRVGVRDAEVLCSNRSRSRLSARTGAHSASEPPGNAHEHGLCYCQSNSAAVDAQEAMVNGTELRPGSEPTTLRR